MKYFKALMEPQFPATEHYVPGKVYTLRISDLQTRPEQLDTPLDQVIISLLSLRIKGKETFQKVVFTQEFDNLIVIAGDHWLEAARQLGINHIRGCYVESSWLDAEDFLMEEGMPCE